MAGKSGKCPRCAALIVVPALPLSKITPDEVVAEFHRRGKSAVLIVFETPDDGNYALHESKKISVSCVGSDDMSDTQLQTLIRSIATLSQLQEQGALLNDDERSTVPYEFKGDRLGMDLEEFKRKYHRKVKGDPRPAPCSSEYNPRYGNPSLLAESWHTDAGIVHCSLDFPFELYSDRPKPTVAGVDAELLVYKFVDGKMYQISAFFETPSFETVRSALIEKYGEPAKEDKRPAMLFWWNGCSSISLRRGKLNPKQYSHVHFTLDELQSIVLERTPSGSEDL